MTSIVLGINKEGNFDQLDEKKSKSLSALWKAAKTSGQEGETRVFYAVGDSSDHVAAVSLGSVSQSSSENEKAEATRRAAALGARALHETGCSDSISVDSMLSSHASAEGANLALFKYSLKAGMKDKERIQVNQLKTNTNDTSSSGLNWETGTIYAEAQNLARELMEIPANMLTPILFSERIVQLMSGLENVTVQVHDENWAKEKKMGSFLSVARGSDEPPRFVEVHYKGNGGDQFDYAFVGKGVTFDSGGISIKGAEHMDLMRGDMGGAASVLSAIRAAAQLKLKVNVVAVTPLTENLPSGKATKPGDVVVASNGLTIDINNTDAEGRLILADALYYATSTYRPHTVIDVATLTGAIGIALGSVFIGLFSSDDGLADQLKEAGEREHDRYWRMPLDPLYCKKVKGASNSDLCNACGRPGGACNAAAFLSFFIWGLNEKKTKWAHLDIAGVMETSDDAYDVKGMSGRGTRPQ
eukprot:TRINITY_DN7916_c0_g1_i1.p1 TRINITY_DN7916_c0_g1~~TRINITY_DN7916_c0_g1_i1.p1  ORF type:complete len:472 (-),score=143.18 TRINITY_DN7916_c0_g1_i1:90-1505(-)